jgi:hypothetical protein
MQGSGLGSISESVAYNELANDFNLKSRAYFVTIVNYVEGYEARFEPLYPELGDENLSYKLVGWAEAYQEAKEQLGRDLTIRSKERKTPDIIIIRSTSEYHEYARAGVLADLTEFYERDIDQTLVFGNFFDAMKVGGKLYGIATGFVPRGIYMDKRFASLELSNLEAMLALQRESDYPLWGYTNQMMSFQGWFGFYQHEFIDWENWRCDFDRPNFISILEIASNTPADEEETYFNIINKAIREQKPFFISGTAQVYHYQAMKRLFGGNVAFANYAGSSVLDVEAYPIYAIAANSPYKEAAWDFISELISEEYQRKHVDTTFNRDSYSNKPATAFIWGVPASRNALELVIADGFRENRPPERLSFFGDGINDGIIEVSQLEPEAVEEARRIWEQDMRLFFEDENINMIIGEEVSAYFGGFISKERLIENLNNRVQLYLNEIKP